ncbi:hypothetical protein [Aquimarina mytili]|uniref:Uncharacterized protein n=1 Tax=Aquimarina mytili TaxID=874423 RepID=A0A937A6Z9_9FLAO|nr:hypothetical protein [Aquimarina mytili]MBL0685414.1 hypothetical protein [Aquimarina mytili]
MSRVYKIHAIDDKNVILIGRKNPAKPENYTEGLTNEEHPKDSFTGTKLKILKSVFVTGMISNSDMILSVFG